MLEIKSHSNHSATLNNSNFNPRDKPENAYLVWVVKVGVCSDPVLQKIELPFVIKPSSPNINNSCMLSPLFFKFP